MSLQGRGASAELSQTVQFALINPKTVETPYESSVKQILFEKYS